MTFDPQRLDVPAFAARAASLEGNDALHRYERLAQESDATRVETAVNWRASGRAVERTGAAPELWLDLEAQTVLAVTCQRCLQPMDVSLHVEHSYRFVGDEATATEQDEVADEDVLVLSASFSLHDLIEDELLMAIPVVPKHAQCPSEVRMSAQDAEFDSVGARRENPFAALAQLKSGRSKFGDLDGDD